ncbi:hydroxyacid dehydrogenase [Paenibacillus sp. HJGM_3]|uniref:hydroxyacid dehydrogenase n=1 Tax=Paenibacillus sp. HJGM_3 TaxID=3379816 RepID=UPI003858E2D8
MRTLIAVSNPDFKTRLFRAEAIRKLEAVSAVDWVPEGQPFTEADLAEWIPGYDACLTTWGSPKFTPAVIARADRLRYIGHAAGTIVPIVDPAVFEREPEIVVANANHALGRSTAELVLTLMLAGAWNLGGYTQELRNGIWRDSTTSSVLGLYGQTVGLIGYGEISRELIRLLRPFDVHVLLYSRNCPEAEAAELGVELCGLDDLLRRSAIVSLHNTLTEQTRGMIGREQLRLMRDGALLVNTARGPIVQEAALVEELRTGRLFAALDVYDTEPLPMDHPLLQLPNAICAPHIGALSSYWRCRLGEHVIDDLLRLLRGEPLVGHISREKFAIMSPR